MKKSLIVTHIANSDYPLFRAWLDKYHTWFDEILIVWDIAFRFPFYNTFMQASLTHIPNIKFFDPPTRELGIDDWRHTATNFLVTKATGDWIVSIEQDWFARDWDHLLKTTSIAMGYCDMTGWMNPTVAPYIHPSYWFMKRELLDKIGPDFTPHSEIDGSDHFAMMTYKAREAGAKIMPIQDMGVKADLSTPEMTDAYHLGGVNMNYLDFDVRLKADGIHRAELFYIYNYYSIRANVPQSPEFLDRMHYVDEHLKQVLPDVDPEISPWAPFFKL